MIAPRDPTCRLLHPELLVANLLSFVISRRFQPAPIYHALLKQDGVELPAARG